MPSSLPDQDATRFIQGVLSQGLLDPTAADCLREFAVAQPKGHRDELARFLVQAGLLSAYQVDQVYRGQSLRLVVGPYRIVEPLHAGDQGTVYRAVGMADRQSYAIKVMPG